VIETKPTTKTAPLAVPPGGGDSFWFMSGRATMKATGAQTDGAFGLLEMQLPPGFGPPLHVHAHEDELFWILEGELKALVGDHVVTAGPGGFVFLPRGVPHAFRVEGTAPARFVVTILPGGGEQFFVDAGRPAEHAGLPAPAPLDPARLAPLWAKHGITPLGPPLPPS
jgi:mannose-6-phosphate isomerase-like protein (cupin superfamily)